MNKTGSSMVIDIDGRRHAHRANAGSGSCVRSVKSLRTGSDYLVLRSRIIDRQVLEGIAKLIQELEAKKKALHPET